jgi:hypothetical protein
MSTDAMAVDEGTSEADLERFADEQGDTLSRTCPACGEAAEYPDCEHCHYDFTAPGNAVDLDAAARFLSLLDESAERFTFQTFDDTAAKRGELACVLHGTLAEHHTALAALNARGAGVFVTINETDLHGRQAANVTHVRAGFADTDGAPLAPIMECGLEPSFVVESSPGKWHAYWLTDDLSLDQFAAVQKGIAAKFGTDSSVCDLPRVLRLPGFDHRKGAPFRVRLIHESGGQPYAAERVRAMFAAPAATPTPATTPEVTTASHNGEGVVIGTDRHGDLLTLCANFARMVKFNGLSQESAFAALSKEAARGRWTRDIPADELHRAFAGALAKYTSGEWAGPVQPVLPNKVNLPHGWKLQPIGELLAQPSPIDWLVRGVLEKNSLACIFGAPGSGKSFIAVDLAACIAMALSWHGHAVKQGAVVYLAGEGHSGLRRRFLAWSIEHGIDLSHAPLLLSSAAIDLNGARDATIAAIEAACGDVRPSLLIVDTLHRHLKPGADENSSTDMGDLIAAADAIRQRFGCAVVIVHHSGHAATDRERGSSALRGAMDWSYSVAKGDGGPVIFTCRKSKDFEQPEPMQFELHSIALPWLNDEGEPETSAVLRVTGATATGMGANQLIAMTHLRKLLEKGEAVTVDAWRAAVNPDRRRWKDTQTSLIERGLILIDGDHVVLPETHPS